MYTFTHDKIKSLPLADFDVNISIYTSQSNIFRPPTYVFY